ncbi:MAG: enolase C-terminal domain-like protein, partial [Spirochaetia bacterium]
AELPRRATFLCAAPFDIALHDAYGHATDSPIYGAYSAHMLTHDLSWYFGSTDSRFKDKYPGDYVSHPVPDRLPVWHLVGCGDTVTETTAQSSEVVGARPRSLRGWVEQDGLTRFKIKMCGSSLDWDYRRVLEVGTVAEDTPSSLLSLDFNGTAPDASYVTSILSKLSRDAPSTYDRISYVEQPFSPEQPLPPSALTEVSALKPVFVDEGATGWEETREAYAAGYAGVALKTCKTQTAAILSACWARENGMQVSVQDLTNPMLAQIPHVLLAAHFSPELGVESNSMQFCPEASRAEARVHPYLYDRRDGMLCLSTIGGPGFGYRIEEIRRELPECVA